MKRAKITEGLELYFVDRKGKTLQRFAIVDNLPGLLDILQIVLDSCTGGLSDVTARDIVTGKYYSPAKIAAHFGMRKRSFDEKLANVKTYTLEDMEK